MKILVVLTVFIKTNWFSGRSFLKVDISTAAGVFGQFLVYKSVFHSSLIGKF